MYDVQVEESLTQRTRAQVTAGISRVLSHRQMSQGR